MARETRRRFGRISCYNRRTMNARERFNRVLHWQKPDRVPNLEFGYWDKTVLVWHEQGLPSSLRTNEDIERYLGLEGTSIIAEVPVKNGLYPLFEEKTLETRGERRIIQNKEGLICEVLESDSSIPRYLKYVIETRADWEKLKRERLDTHCPGRVGEMSKAVEAAHSQGLPVRFDAGSLYGWLRNWMGLEKFSFALLEDRKWVEEMIDHLTALTLNLIERSLHGAGVDVAWWWEDMCYSRGPLLSPVLFEELMVPRYKLITTALRARGIDVNVLDCDGRIYDLVPGWLRAGINCMFPIEAAHTDPFRLRQEYGREILLIGGVNKLSLIQGKETIDRELERLHPLVEQGGFIPCVDHRVPPDVTFENYLYYLEKKKRIL